MLGRGAGRVEGGKRSGRWRHMGLVPFPPRAAFSQQEASRYQGVPTQGVSADMRPSRAGPYQAGALGEADQEQEIIPSHPNMG